MIRSLVHRHHTESGFVAAEFALGIGLLVFPVALLVLTLPSWSERQVTGRAIARETARRVARDMECDRAAAAQDAAAMARNLGLDPADVRLELDCAPGTPLDPGAEVEASVTVRIPAVQIPGVGAVGEWSWTARHREPVDPFGSAP